MYRKAISKWKTITTTDVLNIFVKYLRRKAVKLFFMIVK